MKKLSLFLTVLVFLGNINAQETGRQLSKNLETAKDVSTAQKIDRADAKTSFTSNQKINSAEVKERNTPEKRAREINPVQKIDRANAQRSLTPGQKINRADIKDRMAFDKRVKTTPTQKINKAPLRAGGEVFFEDFESYYYETPPGGGWLTVSNNSLAWQFAHWTVFDDYNWYYDILGEMPGNGYQTVGIVWSNEGEGDHDDWLISPAISLTADVEYQISFYVQMEGYYGQEKLALHIGTGQTVAAMNAVPLWSKEGDIMLQEISVNFTPTTTGSFYLGFYSYSGEYSYYTSIDDILVREVPDCSNPVSTFPWLETFNSAVFPPDCWSRIHSGPESGNWQKLFDSYYNYDGNFAYRPYAYDYNEINQSSFLITPAISIPATGYYVLDFMSYIFDAYYYQHSSVRISTTVNDNVSAFTTLYTLNGTDIAEKWQKLRVYLNDYAGQTIYLAFVYEGGEDHGWGIDNVNIVEIPTNDAAITAITAPVSGINFTTEDVTVTIKNEGGAPITTIDLTLTVDGVEIATETFITNIASNTTKNYTFIAKADLSAEGEHTIMVTASLEDDEVAANDSKTVTVKNTICNAITSFPWTENFTLEVGQLMPDCWQTLGGDEVGNQWIFGTLTGGNGVAGSFSYYYTALHPDNWLVTPQLVLDADYKLTFRVGAADQPYHAEKYSVLVSTTGTNINSDFTEIYTETLSEGSFKTVILPLSAYAGQSIYVAFRHWDCTGMGNLLLDDVKVSELKADELEIIANAPYTQIPVTQLLPPLSAKAKNVGTATQTDVTLSVELDGNSLGTSTPVASLASLATTAALTVTPAIGVPLGDNTLTYEVSSTEGTEAQVTFSIKGTEDTFAIDNVTDENNGVGGNGAMTLGNIFTVTKGTYIKQVIIGFSDAKDYSSLNYSISIYTVTGDLKINTTALFTQAATRGVTGGFVTIDVPLTALAPGKYLLGVNQLSSTNILLSYDADPNHTSYYTVSGGDLIVIPANLSGLAIRMVVGEAPPVAVQTLKPAANDEDVALNAEVSVTFNIPVIAGDLTGITINDVPAAASVSGNKLTITHDAFDYQKEYTVTIPVGAIDGYEEIIEWTFITIKPVIQQILIETLTPEDGAENVALGTEVSVTFNQYITPVNLTGVTISNTAFTTANVSGNKLIISHDAFAYGTTYTVTVPSGAIDGYNEVIIWTFKTISEVGIPIVTENEINIYQNNGNIFVQPSENSDVRLLDVLGRVIGNYNVAANATLTINQLSGIYLIEVISNGNVSTHKIVVR